MSTPLTTARQRVLYEARELWQRGFVTFDTETTGLTSADQIIQWAVCSQEGEVMGSGYIKPTVPISDGAFEKHGIRESDLIDAPSFAQVWPTMRELLTDKTVVIYNEFFDLGMLWSSARAYQIAIPYDAITSVCAMQLFARFYGEAHEYFGTYIWQKLNEVAIPYLNIAVPGQAHNAKHDAAATALIIKKLAALADQELASDWHPPVVVPCAGCAQVDRECKEANEIWYCQRCGLKQGVYHRCPGCQHVVEKPASGIVCEDICTYCHEKLHQETMLLTGAWHYCPDSPYHIVKTPDLAEPCEHCKKQREWKRLREEAEQLRQAKIEQERKERRRAYAKDYRKKRKEREEENRHRVAMGLLPLEVKKDKPEKEIITYHGHQFRQVKENSGCSALFCIICEASWSSLPRCFCAGIKTYRSWSAIPEHLKTRTQLLKVKLKPAKGQKPEAVMDCSLGRYSL
jgi:DNA polymerase-3 subunit epsilon